VAQYDQLTHSATLAPAGLAFGQPWQGQGGPGLAFGQPWQGQGSPGLAFGQPWQGQGGPGQTRSGLRPALRAAYSVKKFFFDTSLVKYTIIYST